VKHPVKQIASALVEIGKIIDAQELTIGTLQDRIEELTTQNLANGKLVLDTEEELAEAEARIDELKECVSMALDYVDTDCVRRQFRAALKGKDQV